MIRTLINRRCILMLLLGTVVFSSRATIPDVVRFDFDYYADTTGWIESCNASSLFCLPVNRSGRAGIYYKGGWGELTGFNTAEKYLSIEARGESWFRLSPKTMLYGFASFESATEKNSNGSAFMNRDERAFDIILADPENKGTRKTEWYRIGASLGHEINSRFAMGLRMNYNAGNMARIKDLRHTNKALDMEISPGATVKLTKYLKTGLHYTYKRYIEGVSFKTFGTTDQQYFSLISFGAFFGKQEIFGANGYTAKETTTPYVENQHEIGWQLEYRPTSVISFFNELLLGNGSGYYGKKSSASVVYTEHETNQIGDRFVLSLQGEKYRHGFDLYFRKSTLVNYENSWRSETSSAGNTVIEYYGKNEAGNRERLRLAAEYHLEWGDIATRPFWRIYARGAYEKRDIRAILYPYFRKQHLRLTAMETGVLHRRMIGVAELAANLKVGFAKGAGDRNIDGTIVTPSSDNGKPVSADYYLNREYDYLLSSRIQSELDIRITLPIGGVSSFAGLGYGVEQAVGETQVKGNRQRLNISLGVNF